MIYLILSAGLKMLKGIPKTPFSVTVILLTVAVSVLLSLFAVRFFTVLYILICGTVGVLVFLIGKARKEERNDLS